NAHLIIAVDIHDVLRPARSLRREAVYRDLTGEYDKVITERAIPKPLHNVLRPVYVVFIEGRNDGYSKLPCHLHRALKDDVSTIACDGTGNAVHDARSILADARDFDESSLVVSHTLV